ncbi:MAG TPA: hypothetical protein VF053_09225 [Streptosporangiales bacterium]
MKDRVKGLLGGQPNELGEHVDQRTEPTTPQQALQVLDLAQRTADEYVASARREANRICAEGRVQAEQMVRDAQVQVQALQREAEKALAEAQAKADQVARDVQAHADRVKRDAEGVLSEARNRANDMVKNAQVNAEELKRQAQHRHDDVVGSLAAKREALQRQIEALEVFEREYRERLSGFMQNQLRALWVDEPRLNAEEIEKPIAPPPAQAKPAQAKPEQPKAEQQKQEQAGTAEQKK